MKDIGLVGVPFSGKSTLFTALTRTGSQGGHANIAVVSVPDPRLAVLAKMERSAKTVAAQVRFLDVPGGVRSAQAVAKLRESDALAVVESALHKAEKRAKGKPAADVAALRAAHEALSEERPLRDAGLAAETAAELRAIAPLTMK